MLFSELVEYFERLEKTTSRIEMTDILVSLFHKTPSETIDKVVYLTLGVVYPEYVGLELGIADKLALRALKQVTNITDKQLSEYMAKLGDLGLVAETVITKKEQMTLFSEPLTVEKVYSLFEKIAKTTGEGSIDLKIQILAGLLAQASPKEAKHILRIVTGKMRLGVADMTILDALAILYGGSKDVREHFERAYNISSDIGLVAKVAATEGLEGIKKFKISIGKPIRPMLAERLASADEILEKLDGKGMAEYKYDGERMQIHKSNDKIIIYSRRQENITHQYPDVVEEVKKQIKAKETILECETVAIDVNTGEMLPFQELMHRKRKKEIEKAIEEYPVNMFFFDVLYIDGEDFTVKPLLERRHALESILQESEMTRLSKAILVGDKETLERFFEEAVAAGCEGVMVKAVGKESIYRAGARGWLWIKYKRDYKSEMIDTVDLVIVGGFYGRGKRSGRYGALLLAVYDKTRDTFQTVCKVGSGFTDEDLEKFHQMLESLKLSHKHARVESIMEADVWFEPKIVIEVIGAEITQSPVHTCARDKIKKDTGLAIRFPRYTGRLRTDKKPEDATTAEEIIEMYNRQLKKITEAEKVSV
ncbi:MAG TPA: ATP-dependent DNA ligase [Candidatus Caldiarchaeum subterraneum]|uniref:DNA ligase n=1 Tax=Caldiarchaeum subterraneum TaxID=311458 RepID=A0A833A5C4_CALS0|nr:ATP-dependent DNA ligase [Candidatus Caldarchaeum subterraneum]